MRTYDPRTLISRMFPPAATSPEIAAALHVNHRTVQRWRTGQIRLNEQFADQLACHLGVHPANIWPNWFDDD